jgi:hypothetical protein
MASMMGGSSGSSSSTMQDMMLMQAMQGQGGQQGGSMNPMMMASMMGEDVDPMTMYMMSQQQQQQQQQQQPKFVRGADGVLRPVPQQQQQQGADLTQMLMMQSMMGDKQMSPLIQMSMMGGNSDSYLRNLGMASMLKGNDVDNDSMVKAMMVTGAMGGGFNRAGSTSSNRAAKISECDEDDEECIAEEEATALLEEAEDLPPIAYQGVDSSFQTAKSEEEVESGRRLLQQAVPVGFSAAIKTNTTAETKTNSSDRVSVVDDRVTVVQHGSNTQMYTMEPNVQYAASPPKGASAPIIRNPQGSLPYRPIAFGAAPTPAAGMNMMEMLLLSRLSGGGSKKATTVRSVPGTACYCDDSCSKSGDCCSDFSSLCKDSATKSSGASAGMSLATMNALTGDKMGMGNIDPMTSMLMGFDPLTAMLMSQQNKGTCRSRCGIAAPRPNPTAVNQPSNNMFGRRLLQDDQDDKEEDKYAGFFNDAGLPVDVSAEASVELKEGVAEASNRFVYLGEEKQKNTMDQCGCDSLCSYYGNCCNDYQSVCRAGRGF